jgi:hypothetical protein
MMILAASSPLAKLSQLVTDGIARTAEEFATVIKTEGLIIKNANQLSKQHQAKALGVGAGEGYSGDRGSKGKDKENIAKDGKDKEKAKDKATALDSCGYCFKYLLD